MGMFEDLAKGALGAMTGSQGGMAGVVAELLSPEKGGLQGLVQQFERAGFGDMIKGWISTGPNPAISADQLQAALGPEMLQKLAGAAGLEGNALLAQLSSHLPDIIDKLTPDGAAPSNDALQQGLAGILGTVLGGKS